MEWYTMGRATAVLLAVAVVMALMPAASSADVLASDAEPTSVDVAASCSGRTGSQVSRSGPFGIGETFVVEIPSEVDGTTIQIWCGPSRQSERL